MGNEQGTGYVVLDLRMTEAEKDIKAVSDKLENHISKNDDEHKELRAGIAESNLIAREINIKMSQMVQNSDDMKRSFKESTDEMKKDFKESTDEIKTNMKAIGDSQNKEKGWRAVIQDLVKIILMILGFILGGKYIL